MPNMEATPGVFAQKPPLQPLPSPTPANKTLLRKADTAAIGYRAEREAEGKKTIAMGYRPEKRKGQGTRLREMEKNKE